ncbi:MAG: 4-(cytidine 5'-diphospho)-2-C-methyl-D-erythritol kinase [Candidatus Omnitrophica bacterium]|nr:4-(cytidine 5'-diphospho)-2-C-methyl-D-erythritol kinase [Candidatus Omnitrophota bacterium]
MSNLTLLSPAKINLYLKVLGKREDGYHNIETVMQKIDLCDTLILKEKRRGIKVFCDNKEVPVDENNLCYQAADLLIKDFSLEKGVEIFIKKKIPVAAGLGGGSSNGATVFLGLNELWNLQIAEKKLLEMGTGIGADVPFFISPFLTAKCIGKGDEVSPFSFPPASEGLAGSQRPYYLLVVPNFLVSTKEIYSQFRFSVPQFSLSQHQSFGTLELSNDLEKTVIRKFPLVARIREEFEKMSVKSNLSGSGPSVFGIFKSRKEVIEKEKSFRKFGRTYICRLFNMPSKTRHILED